MYDCLTYSKMTELNRQSLFAKAIYIVIILASVTHHADSANVKFSGLEKCANRGDNILVAKISIFLLLICT